MLATLLTITMAFAPLDVTFPETRIGDVSESKISRPTPNTHDRYALALSRGADPACCMKGRFQLPNLGKFNRPDPMRDWNWLAPHTMNLYEYVGNDPVNGWDPTGLQTDEWNKPDPNIKNPTGNATLDTRAVRFLLHNIWKFTQVEHKPHGSKPERALAKHASDPPWQIGVKHREVHAELTTDKNGYTVLLKGMYFSSDPDGGIPSVTSDSNRKSFVHSHVPESDSGATVEGGVIPTGDKNNASNSFDLDFVVGLSDPNNPKSDVVIRIYDSSGNSGDPIKLDDLVYDDLETKNVEKSATDESKNEEE